MQRLETPDDVNGADPDPIDIGDPLPEGANAAPAGAGHPAGSADAAGRGAGGGTGTSSAAPPVRRTATAVAAAVAVAHAVNDVYTGFLPPLLPRIMAELGLSITLAATLAMTLSLAASLAQPLLGWISDVYGRRRFVVLGPLMTGVFLSLIGVAPNFATLVAVLALGGLGSAMFHPPGASLAARASEGRGSGLRASLFSFGGSAGYAAGPLIAVGIVAWRGLDGLWVAMLPVLALSLALAALLPSDPPARGAAAPPRPLAVLRVLRGPLGPVFAISAAGAFVQRTFLVMEPIVVAERGGSEALGALALSAYLAGQALGSLTGGTLADRVDRRGLLLGLATLSFPAHFLALWLPPGSPGALAAALAAGLFQMALLPPIVVIAQEALPAGAALGSGIVMGLAWSLGSIAVLGAGALGDALGPRTAALLATPVILAAGLLALHPALRAHRRPAAPLVDRGRFQ
ncbi:MAG TPA: MFS transporter [Longimicrobiales bacterium]